MITKNDIITVKDVIEPQSANHLSWVVENVRIVEASVIADELMRLQIESEANQDIEILEEGVSNLIKLLNKKVN